MQAKIFFWFLWQQIGPFKSVCSAVAYSLFGVAAIVCEGLVLGPRFVLQFLVSFLVLQ